jgi:hypothetical protein
MIRYSLSSLISTGQQDAHLLGNRTGSLCCARRVYRCHDRASSRSSRPWETLARTLAVSQSGGYLIEWTRRAIFWINIPVALVAVAARGVPAPAASAQASRIAQLQGGSGNIVAVPAFIRADFAAATRDVLYGMAIIMALAVLRRDRDAQDRYLFMVEFAYYEQGMENSGRPEGSSPRSWPDRRWRADVPQPGRAL